MIKMARWISLSLILTACVAMDKTTSLYEQLGGADTINLIANEFIDEIGYDPMIYPFFKDTNIDRFRQKFSEHLCAIADGPCEYTGDSMIEVHTNMGVNEQVFNRTVELLINAMDNAGVSHPLQNTLIKRLAPMREDIIYR